MDIRERVSNMTQDQLMEALRLLAEAHPEDVEQAIINAVYNKPWRNPS